MNKTKKLNLIIMAGALCLASGQMAARAQNAPYTGAQSTANNAACTQVMKMDKCSQLIGSTVQNAQGEKLGKIHDIVLDLNNGHVAYCVLSVSHDISSTPKFLAVPVTAFQCSENGSHLILNASTETLAQAQGFDRNNWPAPTTQAWGAQPFWQRPTAPSSHELPRVP